MMTNKRGISLIVLVITLIVMIILAAAIILTLSSDGIISTAEHAKTNTDLSSAKAVVAVAESEWMLEKQKIKDEYNVSTFKEYAEKRLSAEGFVFTSDTLSKEGTIEVTEAGEVYMYPVIPQGFVASDISTEDEVLEGLVIYQGIDDVSTDEDAVTTRNQFVWVPVTNISEFRRADGYNNGVLQSYISSGVSTEPYSKITKANDSTGEYAEYYAMRESVEKYGGFYIARYEAGKEGTDTVISKKNATVWNSIEWGASMISVGTTGAVAKARGMYINNDSVVSHLIYGVQWDAALAFISRTDPTFVKNGTGKGVYGVSQLAKSGSNIAYAKNNIYDMAGNVREWTMEGSYGDKRLARSGSCKSSPTGGPASFRFEYSADAIEDSVGFRVVLYLK